MGGGGVSGAQYGDELLGDISGPYAAQSASSNSNYVRMDGNNV